MSSCESFSESSGGDLDLLRSILYKLSKIIKYRNGNKNYTVLQGFLVWKCCEYYEVYHVVYLL
jgi:hypothetical protein